MWKPETDNQTMPPRVPPIEGQQKKILCPERYKTLLGKDCEVEKIMRFLKEINIF